MSRRASRSTIRHGCQCGHAFGARTDDTLCTIPRDAHLLVRGSVWLLCPECQLPRTLNPKGIR
jgi:hypothetical protein